MDMKRQEGSETKQENAGQTVVRQWSNSSFGIPKDELNGH